MERVLPAGHPLSEAGATQTFWMPSTQIQSDLPGHVFILDAAGQPSKLAGDLLQPFMLDAANRDASKRMLLRCRPARLLSTVRTHHQLAMQKAGRQPAGPRNMTHSAGGKKPSHTPKSTTASREALGMAARCAKCARTLQPDDRIKAVRCFSCGPSSQRDICPACAASLGGWLDSCARCLPPDPSLEPGFKSPIPAVVWNGIGFALATPDTGTGRER